MCHRFRESNDVSGMWATCERFLSVYPRVCDDVEFHFLLGELAADFIMRGDCSSARTLLRRALAIQVKTLGPFHPVVGRTVLYLVQMLTMKDR
jgi:hypothetical protein